MTPDTQTIILIGLIVAMIFTIVNLHDATQPQYRKGCAECAAAVREQERKQVELQHDYEHRQGWPNDRYSCSNDGCNRNPKRVD